MTVKKTQMLIIGAGPVGLFTVFEAGLVDIQCTIVDILPVPGGQCAELYPEKPIYDIPGIPIVTGNQLTENLLEQIKPFSPELIFNRMVNDVQPLHGAEGWSVHLDDGTVIECDVLVIAAGAGCFMPKRLPILNATAFEGTSLFYSVKKIENHVGKKVIVAGGGDSALDWAITLGPVSEKMTLVHRRDEFRAAPASVNEMQERRRKGEMDFIAGQITGLEGEEGKLTAVHIGDQRIEADHLLVFYGLTINLGPVGNWGLELERSQIKVDTEKFETSTPRIFAVGDINWYPGKLKLILSGFHECALMAQAAHRYIYPDRKLKFQYTTTATDLHNKLGVS